VIPLFLALLVAPAAGPHPVSVTVFYDENGNGIPDTGENVRLPNVLVEADGVSGRTEAGRVLLTLPEGIHEISVRPETLPPFYTPGPPVRVEVPRDREVSIPVALQIGSNRPNTYLGFGDSITEGEGSTDRQGYRAKLEALLKRYLGSARVEADGVSGASSDRGIRRIRETLAKTRPAFTLVLMGTNDWDDSRPPEETAQETVSNLRTILRRIRTEGSIPLVATLPPPNVGYDWRVPRERDQWVVLVNRLIAPMATEEGAALADLYGAFQREPQTRRLFADHLHPNDHGYEVIVQTLFKAIVERPAPSSEQPAGTPSSKGRPNP
jgi:lysophospholipase L1-like esterase